MNCRDVQLQTDTAGSDMPAELARELARHLTSCVSCREALDSDRAIRERMRTAFEHAPDLQPSAHFVDRVRAGLRAAVPNERPRRGLRVQWLALAATLTLTAGLATRMYMYRSAEPGDRLAIDAVGDHQNCALKYRLVRMPVPLDEAARRFDRSFRLFLDQPADTIATRLGNAHVTERHSCAFETHRFAHVILRYRGHVVSLLLTRAEVHAGDIVELNGFTVLTVPAAGHAILLVSDLTREDLEPLVESVSVPLAKHIEAVDVPARLDPLARLDSRQTPKRPQPENSTTW